MSLMEDLAFELCTEEWWQAMAEVMEINAEAASLDRLAEQWSEDEDEED